MIYSALTLARFAAAERAGRLAGPQICRGAAGSVAEGTWVQFDVRTGKGPSDSTEAGAAAYVVAARFLAFGCPHVIAVADWVAEAVIGQPALPVLPETVHGLRRRFDVPVEKLGRLLVIEDAWIAALSSPPHEV